MNAQTRPVKIDVVFCEQDKRMNVRFGTSKQNFPANFGQIQQVNVLDPYDGDYSITPQLTAQTLETAKKYMSNDVEVKEIPIYVVSNNSGGNTVTIG